MRPAADVLRSNFGCSLMPTNRLTQHCSTLTVAAARAKCLDRGMEAPGRGGKAQRGAAHGRSYRDAKLCHTGANQEGRGKSGDGYTQPTQYRCARRAPSRVAVHNECEHSPIADRTHSVAFAAQELRCNPASTRHRCLHCRKQLGSTRQVMRQVWPAYLSIGGSSISGTMRTTRSHHHRVLCIVA